jgi:DNA-binding NtrC family response regulator
MSLKRYERYAREREKFERVFFDFFKKHPLATQSEFADYVGLDSSTVTVKMREYGLVLKRVPDRLSALSG